MRRPVWCEHDGTTSLRILCNSLKAGRPQPADLKPNRTGCTTGSLVAEATQGWIEFSAAGARPMNEQQKRSKTAEIAVLRKKSAGFPLPAGGPCLYEAGANH
jgi:hypothetical protein